MPSNNMQADKLEERCTPTTIRATFALRDLPSCSTVSRGISIHLPLLNFGWTFALSLASRRFVTSDGRRSNSSKWAPQAFSFRQHDSKIPWGNTSMQAQLSLATEPENGIGIENDSTSLGTINVVLAHTPSAELPLTTSYKLSSRRPTTVWLTVTISECPFAKGLFQARSYLDSETEAQTRLARQSGDRVLSRSLTTGKLFDVKFLSSTCAISGNAGKLLPTYASLSVLEKHVNLPDGK